MGSMMRAILISIGAVVGGLAAVQGTHNAIAEVGGIALADHALQSCPNWYLGLSTGAFMVGLAWWATWKAKR
jgi:hypothetical protein